MALDTIDLFQLSVTLQWNVSKARTGLQPIRNTDSQQHRVTFTKGVGAGQINNLIGVIQSVTASATSNLDLVSTLTNVVNDLSVVIARVKLVFFKLLTASDTDQDGNVIGTACSGVTIGGNANAFLFLVDKTDKVTLGNGDIYLQTRKDATGLVATAATGDILDITNNDGAVTAKVLMVLGTADT